MSKALVFLADGFEEVEAVSVIDILRRAKITVDVASIQDQIRVRGAHDITIEADKLLSDIRDINSYDAVITPGGLPGSTNLRDDELVISFIKEASQNKKIVASICASPIVLEKAGLTAGKAGTSFPGMRDQVNFAKYKEDLVVQDDKLITSRGPATALLFALELVKQLKGIEVYKEIREALLIPLLQEQIKDY